MERPLRLVVPGEATLDPPFARVGIVGLDAVGCSIGLATRHHWPTSLVIGVDRNAAIEAAVARHAVDVGADDLGMLAEADLVVLNVAVDQTLLALDALPDVIGGAALVTEVGGAGIEAARAAAHWPSRLTFVGSRLAAGDRAAGTTLAPPSHDRLAGWLWMLMPGATAPPGEVARLKRFALAVGARPVVGGTDDDATLAESGSRPATRPEP